MATWKEGEEDSSISELESMSGDEDQELSFRRPSDHPSLNILTESELEQETGVGQRRAGRKNIVVDPLKFATYKKRPSKPPSSSKGSNELSFRRPKDCPNLNYDTDTENQRALERNKQRMTFLSFRRGGEGVIYPKSKSKRRKEKALVATKQPPKINPLLNSSTDTEAEKEKIRKTYDQKKFASMFGTMVTKGRVPRTLPPPPQTYGGKGKKKKGEQPTSSKAPAKKKPAVILPRPSTPSAFKSSVLGTSTSTLSNDPEDNYGETPKRDWRQAVTRPRNIATFDDPDLPDHEDDLHFNDINPALGGDEIVETSRTRKILSSVFDDSDSDNVYDIDPVNPALEISSQNPASLPPRARSSYLSVAASDSDGDFNDVDRALDKVVATPVTPSKRKPLPTRKNLSSVFVTADSTDVDPMNLALKKSLSNPKSLSTRTRSSSNVAAENFDPAPEISPPNPASLHLSTPTRSSYLSVAASDSDGDFNDVDPALDKVVSTPVTPSKRKPSSTRKNLSSVFVTADSADDIDPVNPALEKSPQNPASLPTRVRSSYLSVAASDGDGDFNDVDRALDKVVATPSKRTISPTTKMASVSANNVYPVGPARKISLSNPTSLPTRTRSSSTSGVSVATKDLPSSMELMLTKQPKGNPRRKRVGTSWEDVHDNDDLNDVEPAIDEVVASSSKRKPSPTRKMPSVPVSAKDIDVVPVDSALEKSSSTKSLTKQKRSSSVFAKDVPSREQMLKKQPRGPTIKRIANLSEHVQSVISSPDVDITPPPFQEKRVMRHTLRRSLMTESSSQSCPRQAATTFGESLSQSQGHAPRNLSPLQPTEKSMPTYGQMGNKENDEPATSLQAPAVKEKSAVLPPRPSSLSKAPTSTLSNDSADNSGTTSKRNRLLLTTKPSGIVDADDSSEHDNNAAASEDTMDMDMAEPSLASPPQRRRDREIRAPVTSPPWGPNHPIMKGRGKALYNKRLVSKDLVEQELKKLEKSPGVKDLSASQQESLTSNLNTYVETMFDNLCDNTKLYYGVWSFQQLTSRLKKDGMLDKKATKKDIISMLQKSVGVEGAKKCEGYLYPNPGKNDTTDIYKN